MRKLTAILISVLALAFVPAFAVDYDVYVDTAINGDQFVMQAAVGSTDTVTFHILNDGAAVVATNYACTLMLAPTADYGGVKTITIAGTESASEVQFSLSSAKVYAGMEGFKVKLNVGSTYVATGVLDVDSTPKANTGDPLGQVGAGVVIPAYRSDTNVTTTATGYTPAFIGQMLIGGAGEGTNGLWVAKGVTTNDWVVIAP